MGRAVKTTTVTVLAPAVPALPSVDATPLHLYAPPPPLGYCYRPLTSASGFNNWSPLTQPMAPVPPVSYQSGGSSSPGIPTVPPVPGMQFYTSEQMAAAFPVIGGYQPPLGSAPYFNAYGVLIGYYVPLVVYNSAQWYTALSNMTYFVFPDEASVAPNGYPQGPEGSSHTGYVDIPTMTGILRVSRTFTTDAAGVLRSAGTSPNPPYCQTKPSYGVIALIDFPGRGPIPGVPTKTSTDYRAGWNAGANSAAVIDGDVHTVFQVDIAAAGAVGFASARVDVTRFDNLSHAFYFDNDPMTAQRRYTVMERGKRIGAPALYASSSTFEIRRVGAGGSVSYVVDGDVVYTSPASIFGPLRVGNALYRGEDAVL